MKARALITLLEASPDADVFIGKTFINKEGNIEFEQQIINIIITKEICENKKVKGIIIG